jgi:hypothetical protein
MSTKAPEETSPLSTWLDAVEHVPSQVQSFVSIFRMVQHQYDLTLNEIKKIAEDNKVEIMKEKVLSLAVRLQNLADKKLELTAAIKKSFGKKFLTVFQLIH